MTDTFARSGERDIFGKLDDSIEFRINGDIKADMEIEAHRCGMDPSEFMRMLLYVRLKGLEHVISLKQARIERAIGNVGQMTDGRML